MSLRLWKEDIHREGERVLCSLWLVGVKCMLSCEADVNTSLAHNDYMYSHVVLC